MHFDGEFGEVHAIAYMAMLRPFVSSCCPTVNIDMLAIKAYSPTMRRTPRNAAPQGFIDLLQELMQKREISLNQVAEQAGMSPAFLSRILNRKRGIPSDSAILRLAKVLDLKPPERLLIEAGRIPEELKPALTNPQMPALLRATEKLSESDLQQVLKTMQALAVKHHKRERTA